MLSKALSLIFWPFCMICMLKKASNWMCCEQKGSSYCKEKKTVVALMDPPTMHIYKKSLKSPF